MRSHHANDEQPLGPLTPALSFYPQPVDVSTPFLRVDDIPTNV